MPYHSRQELVVDDVAQFVGIGVDDVLEDLKVSLRLRERRPILNGHCLTDDEFGDFGICAAFSPPTS